MLKTYSILRLESRAGSEACCGTCYELVGVKGESKGINMAFAVNKPSNVNENLYTKSKVLDESVKYLAKLKAQDLPPEIRQNFKRFIKKAPSNSKTITYEILKNGDHLFRAVSPGKVPGAKAVYEKWVNSQGNTYRRLKLHMHLWTSNSCKI